MPNVAVDKIIFREDLYPRFEPNPSVIQQYAEAIDHLPPIEVNQHYELIDGYHRLKAHKKAKAEKIPVTITKTKSDAEFQRLAIERNATHGLQLSMAEKKSLARNLYAAKVCDKEELIKLLKVSKAYLYEWVKDIDRAAKEERRREILTLYLACHTEEEIGRKLKMPQQTVHDELSPNITKLEKSVKLASEFADLEPPIYNVWTFGRKSNEVTHPGNTEQRILEKLLYLYTEPFDIVVDPFAGGGATIDVCKKRLRRYWASDRLPIEERKHDVRKMDVVAGLPPLAKRWAEVSLTYLDPPYWKQAEGKYSKDKADLANMPLDEFHEKLAGVINGFAAKQSKGAIALLMQPTQWRALGREFTDHVIELLRCVNNKRLVLENRVSCPYSTEQCMPQMVDWAKANKKLLVLTRELLIWRVNK